ncbi:MAG: Na+/H+ antiporter subunit E [Blastocatellia bacterium]|nr:Na+/H+ antiporter subunit E [Blastocatellia bacterium]MCS7156685.1 Na+/H+ antiporter subunit E [Blastocatellia bacterium]MDW8168673.1 Na+/H+ antiporter subunit E [Acidobacteriota bacterium]MDW8255836.1 Na+/H+ antiporter subunit E [Acidobacteriota bacterium]
MTLLLWNLLLALAWVVLTGRFAPDNFLLGFLLGYGILLFTHRVLGSPPPYFRKVPQVLGLIVFFLWELILSSLRVAHDVLTPTHYMRPGVVGIPLDLRTDVGITFLANLITLTPGTLSLEVSPDRRTLYIHVMYIDDADAVRRRVKEGFERRIMEVLR